MTSSISGSIRKEDAREAGLREDYFFTIRDTELLLRILGDSAVIPFRDVEQAAKTKGKLVMIHEKLLNHGEEVLTDI